MGSAIDSYVFCWGFKGHHLKNPGMRIVLRVHWLKTPAEHKVFRGGETRVKLSETM